MSPSTSINLFGSPGFLTWCETYLKNEKLKKKKGTTLNALHLNTRPTIVQPHPRALRHNDLNKNGVGWRGREGLEEIKHPRKAEKR